MLRMSDITKRFGATHALRGVSLDVQPGQILALVGENGAGKSTLMKILSGAVRPDSGSMTFNGQTYAPLNPRQAHQAGVAMIYQELNIAPDLSVEDNIMLGQELRSLGLLDRAAQRKRIAEVLQLLGHPDLPLGVPVSRLSIGLQQLVEIARAILSNARLIVFDEPTSSLTAQDAARLFQVIDRLKKSGIAIIYISHFLDEIRRVCDSYVVLRDGELTGSGPLSGVTEEQLITLMVGRNLQDLFPHVPHQQGEPLLELDALSGRELPRDVSCQVRRGEIFGIAGLVGSGRTELLRSLYALDPVRGGTVRIASFSPPPRPVDRIKAGMGFLSEDRKQEGLAQNCSLTDNVTLSRLQPYSTLGWLNLSRRREAVNQLLRKLQVKARAPEQPAHALSGGNQQKVALARVLHQEADLFLLDEPTRGIDVGTKSEIYRLIGQAAAEGKAVIFVSSYLPELLAVCDTIGVMCRGELREIRPAADWTEESIMTAALSAGAMAR
ncbi:MAG: sugar ABC transporter ATP-binding protein [Planctomycetales bacterium]